MKLRMIAAAATVTLFTAAPLFAQEAANDKARGFISGAGGFANTVGDTTGNLLFEGGVRAVPHVMLFGNVGRFHDLQAAIQPTVDAATSSLAANEGLSVVGGGSVPARYASGGVRIEIPTKSRIMPYALGTVGVAYLNPSTFFTYSSGTLPDGTTPDVGTDVTSALVSSGNFTQPPASTSPMFTLGGGIEILASRHWMADAGYRYTRINADSTLSASPLTTNGMTFGFGYRF